VLVLDVAGRLYPLDRDELTIGRSTTCDVCIAHDTISRQHASITREGERYFLEVDRGSSGGFFQGKRFTRQEITAGDKFLLGGYAVYLQIIER
jgi:pSer/pThr/pTyr-binding forkhead associated (FHA) protein